MLEPQPPSSSYNHVRGAPLRRLDVGDGALFAGQRRIDYFSDEGQTDVRRLTRKVLVAIIPSRLDGVRRLVGVMDDHLRLNARPVRELRRPRFLQPHFEVLTGKPARECRHKEQQAAQESSALHFVVSVVLAGTSPAARARMKRFNVSNQNGAPREMASAVMIQPMRATTAQRPAPGRAP